MEPKPGIKTSEFWLTVFTNIAGSIIAILASYDLITTEAGNLWLALAQSIAVAVIPLALAYINGRYIESRAQIKTK